MQFPPPLQSSGNRSIMGATQSSHDEGRRRWQKETNPPRPYSEAVNQSTPLPPQDGPPRLRSPLLPIGPGWQAAPHKTSRVMELTSLERALPERQHSACVCHICGKDLAELGECVWTTKSTPAAITRQQEAAEGQGMIIEDQKKTIEYQKKILEDQKRSLEHQKRIQDIQERGLQIWI